MKRIVETRIMATLVAVALCSLASARAEDEQAQAQAAIANFKSADPGLSDFFAKSTGFVILPSVGEGGLIVGGEHGRGLLFEGDKVTGKVTLTEVSVGAQAGGGSFAEVIFFETPEALKSFKQAKYEMSARAKATVAASGASANAKYNQGIAVFTLPKSGAMVAAAIGGQKFKFEPSTLEPTGRETPKSDK
jgi:lipid-binding SYLF domain-containing protein